MKKVLVDHQNMWMKCTLNPVKVSFIITMQEQVIETRSWKRKKGILVDSDLCRLCGEVSAGFMHIPSGCKMLASREYMTRHNNLLKILIVACCKENELMKRDQAWYKVKWKQGAVLENKHGKMS